MKVTHIDRGAWTEDIFEPDDPPTDTGRTTVTPSLRATMHGRCWTRPPTTASLATW